MTYGKNHILRSAQAGNHDPLHVTVGLENGGNAETQQLVLKINTDSGRVPHGNDKDSLCPEDPVGGRFQLRCLLELPCQLQRLL